MLDSEAAAAGAAVCENQQETHLHKESLVFGRSVVRSRLAVPLAAHTHTRSTTQLSRYGNSDFGSRSVNLEDLAVKMWDFIGNLEK